MCHDKESPGAISYAARVGTDLFILAQGDWEFKYTSPATLESMLHKCLYNSCFITEDT